MRQGNTSSKRIRPSTLVGLLILLLVVAGTFAYRYFQAHNQPPITIRGFVGGEKINFLENEQVKKILEKDYNLKIDIHKAGSLDMIRADHTNVDFLFPSSQTALELYESTIGSPYKDDIIFNTPIVLYSHKLVADALVNSGVASKTGKNGEVYEVDMQKLVTLMAEDKKWSDIGLPQLYGPLTVDTTDPAKSNSGNMFSGLVANMLNQGQVISLQQVPDVLPQLTHIFAKLGYMETSSSDLFSQFLKTGVGAKPLVAGYENQLLEFAKMHPDAWAEVKEDIVILYPVPTVWSTHILIALDENGAVLMRALKDDRLQKIAWEQHGFRTGVYSAGTTAESFGVPGIAENITQIIQMPNHRAMELIINAFE